ncbi:MAG: hypothetical protein WD178_04930 [Actinomycetota bacterium]
MPVLGHFETGNGRDRENGWVQINQYCPWCGAALSPNAARCSSCKRFASLNGSVGIAFSMVMSAGAIAWSLYRGISILWAAVLGGIVLLSLVLFGVLISSLPPPFTGPFAKTWWKEIACGYLLIVSVMAGFAWPAGIGEGEDFTATDILLALIAAPAGGAVVSLPFRFLVRFDADFALCRACGSLMSSRNIFCGNCGRSVK